MKVMMVSPTAYPSGAERVFCNLARTLAARGAQIRVVLLKEGPLEEWLADAGVDCEVLRTGRLRNLASTMGAVRDIRRRIRIGRPDVVIANLASGHIVTGLAVLGTGTPNVWWRHSIPGSAAPDLLHRVAARVPARLVVCPSDASARQQRRLMPRTAVARVHNGVQLGPTAISSEPAEIRRSLGWLDAPVVGIVGRLEDWKGQHLFLEAAAMISARRPDVRFAVVGGAILGTEGDYENQLHTLAASLGITDVVHFAGHTNDSYSWISALDVSVNCSKEEPFGTVILESLALGIPTVATGSGGTPEIIEDERSGLLVPEGDSNAIAAAILRILDDPSLARTLSEGGRRRIQERFTLDKMAESYIREIAAVCVRTSSPKAASKPGPRRVLYLTHCAQLSGAELALSRLLESFNGEVEARVILAEDGPLVDHLGSCGIHAEVLRMAEATRGLPKSRVVPGIRALVAAGCTVQYARRLAKRIAVIQPEIIHTKSLKSAIYGGLAGRMSGVPVVWQLQDRLAADYLPASAALLLRLLARWLPSGILTLEPVRPTIGTFVRCPVDNFVEPLAPELLRGEAYAGSPEAFRVGMLGRIAPWKGQHIFLQAFAQAFGRGDEQAVIIGAALFGEDEYERQLRAMAADLGIADRVEFRGFRSDVGLELSRLNVLVHASVTAEPLGQVVMEGMAFGLPVVASDAGGPSILISHRKNGLLFKPGNVKALASTLAELRNDPDLRLLLGTNATARARDFLPQSVSGTVLGMYQTILHPSSGGRQ
jgi:glycosyltransferase involved in cell wall biosynthesis